MVEVHGAELRAILAERCEGRLRDLGEGRVGRREHRERAAALERAGQAAFFSSEARVLNCPAATAVCTMFLGFAAGAFGIRTESITWMIPFEAMTSVAVTVAPSTRTPPSATLIVTLAPLRVFAPVSLTTLAAGTAPETTW